MMEIVGYIALGLLAAAVAAFGAIHFLGEAMRPNADGNPVPGCTMMIGGVAGFIALIWSVIA